MVIGNQNGQVFFLTGQQEAEEKKETWDCIKSKSYPTKESAVRIKICRMRKNISKMYKRLSSRIIYKEHHKLENDIKKFK